jgi:hypothetical protein
MIGCATAIIINFVLDTITRDPAIKQRYLAEIEERAERFVREHWREIEKLGKKIFERGHLDAQEIEAVLAPPSPVRMQARALPRQPGDEENFYRRQDGYIKPFTS